MSGEIQNVRDADAIRGFWEGRIWGDSKKCSGEAEWIDEVRKSCKSIKEQMWTKITDVDVTRQLGRSMNWKAAGIAIYIDGLSNRSFAKVREDK